MVFIKPIILTALTFVLPMPAMAERIIQVEPGLWEYSYDLVIPGLPIPSGAPKTECISPKEAKQKLSNLITKLATGDAQCTVRDMKDTLNTLKFNVACHPEINGIKFSSIGKASFRYGRTNITGNVSGMVVINEGEPIEVVGQGHARRVGKCPK
jgi:hypothetical protein